MHNKKAQGSPVFKYIFAIVAGVLFISFFIGFAMQHKSGQTKLETGRIVFGFDDLLTLISTAEDSSMIYPEQGFPATVDLTFNDNKITSGTGTEKITRTTTKIIFSQQELKGKQFYIWTKRWKMPFAADNLFYLSDGRVQTYIIYDSDSEEIAEELTDKLSGFPKNFKVEKYKSDLLDAQTQASMRTKLKNLKKIRFVILSQEQPTLFQGAEKMTARPAEINGVKSWDYGTVDYGTGDKSVYLGKEMLIGAILAEDQDSYEKAKEKAMNKLAIMTRLYEQKAKLLERTCPSAYTLIKQKLSTLRTAEPDESTIGSFASQAEELKELNRQLESGCPEVF